MKLRMRRNRDGTVSISFHAQNHREGVALRDAVLKSAREGLSVEGVARALEDAGYGIVETPKKKGSDERTLDTRRTGRDEARHGKTNGGHGS